MVAVSNRVESLLERLPALDLSQELKQSILYKGPSGSGKTHNALSWPKPMIVFHFDKNQRTLRKFARDQDIQIFVPESWDQFSNHIVPLIGAREFAVESIVVDTFDMAAGMMWREIQGRKERLTQPDWGTGLGQQRETIDLLTSATQGIKGVSRSYNIIVTSHLTDVTDDVGALVRTTCKLPGAFKDEVEDYFDSVLLCSVKSSSEEVVVNGRKTILPKAEFFCHTVPPSTYHTCKADGLPARTQGVYSALQKHWAEKE